MTLVSAIISLLASWLGIFGIIFWDGRRLFCLGLFIVAGAASERLIKAYMRQSRMKKGGGEG